MPIPLILAAGMTLLQMEQQRAANENDREVAGATTRYSPWTRLKADPIRKVDISKTIQQGLAAYSAGGGKFGKGGAAEVAAPAAAPDATRSAMGIDYSPMEQFSKVPTAAPAQAGNLGIAGLSPQAVQTGGSMGLGNSFADLGNVGKSFGSGMDMAKLQQYAQQNGMSIWDLLASR